MPDPEQLEEQLAQCDAVLARDRGSLHPTARRRCAMALLMKADLFATLDRMDDAIACCEQVVAEFGEGSEADLRQHARDAGAHACDIWLEDFHGDELDLAQTMSRKCWLLAHREFVAEELASLRELLERFGDSRDPWVRIHVLVALSASVSFLLADDQLPAAIQASEQLLTHFAQEQDPRIRPRAAHELLASTSSLLHYARDPRRSHVFTLTALGMVAAWARALTPAPALRAGGGLARRVREHIARQEQALRLATLLADELRGDPDPQLRKIAAKAEIERSSALFGLGRVRAAHMAFEHGAELGEPAAAGFEDLADQARRRRGPGSEAAAAGMLMGKVVVTAMRENREETLRALADFIERFGEEETLRVRWLVWSARRWRRGILDGKRGY